MSASLKIVAGLVGGAWSGIVVAVIGALPLLSAAMIGALVGVALFRRHSRDV